MKIFDLFLLVIMAGLFIFSLNLFWENYPRGTTEYDDYISNLTVDAKSVSVAQFYPNMRFQNKEITYEISEKCGIDRIDAINAAHDILEEKTIVRFVERENGALQYLCDNVAPESDYESHYVAGEGGPTAIINSTLFSVILSGQVSLYREEKCDTPQVALHETLHALGFDHVNSRKDIMYPITNCNQEIGVDMIESINSIYSIDSYPDLGVEYVKANQTGRYLNFYITIVNYGLVDSEKSSLQIIADEKLVKTFELDEIKIGTKKFINVENLRLDSKDSSKIRFQLKINGNDLNKDNDYAELIFDNV